MFRTTLLPLLLVIIFTFCGCTKNISTDVEMSTGTANAIIQVPLVLDDTDIEVCYVDLKLEQYWVIEMMKFSGNSNLFCINRDGEVLSQCELSGCGFIKLQYYDPVNELLLLINQAYIGGSWHISCFNKTGALQWSKVCSTSSPIYPFSNGYIYCADTPDNRLIYVDTKGNEIRQVPLGTLSIYNIDVIYADQEGLMLTAWTIPPSLDSVDLDWFNSCSMIYSDWEGNMSVRSSLKDLGIPQVILDVSSEGIIYVGNSASAKLTTNFGRYGIYEVDKSGRVICLKDLSLADNGRPTPKDNYINVLTGGLKWEDRIFLFGEYRKTDGSIYTPILYQYILVLNEDYKVISAQRFELGEEREIRGLLPGSTELSFLTKGIDSESLKALVLLDLWTVPI